MHFDRSEDQSNSQYARSVVAPNLQRYRAALLFVLAWCTYTSVPLLSGGRVLVPSFPTVALAPLLFLTVRPNVSKTDEVFLVKITFVLLLSIALSPGYEYVGEKFLGLIQCGMAIAVAILIVRLMQQIQPELLERTLLFLWLLIVVGSILEVFGLIRGVSDMFREWAYGGAYTLYDSDLRDIDMVGWLRPKLFSVEPSHVTKFFVAAINSWLVIRVTWAKVGIVAGATLVMLMIMGSPMLVVSAAITFAILIYNRRTKLRAKVAMIVTTLLIGAVFGSYLGESRYWDVATRVGEVFDSTSTNNRKPGSEQRRMVIPYITLADTWLNWPLFGVGISGKEVVAENTNLSVRNPEIALGNNAMAELGIYLGLAGGAWFVYLLLRQAHETGVRRLGLIVMLIILFSQLMGGIESFRYWGFIAMLWGALAVADAQADRDGGVSAG